ncbi:copper resistance CopC/CopD family protein [Streptomyces xiaopingdaonensis]|uniref:copper resistance CopC/CopD family protein n=1 Tax=Streptomyces xiaopingdaonensis TaxID=1565415 RepID=UPI00030531C5|nr:copper resistance protein CopC [Streptomyces xiaopingdaonensis]
MLSPTPHRPRARLLALLVGLACAAGVLLSAGPAAAHAALLDTSPKEGAVVQSAPKQVVLTFSEAVSMTEGSLRVLDPDGNRVDRDTVRDAGSGGEVQRSVGLEPGLPDGTYTVAWQAISADSHPISGAFTFSVGAPSETSASVDGGEPGGGWVGLLYDVGRYAAYAGFILLVGGCGFVLLCWPGAARTSAVRRTVRVGWLTLTVSTLALLLLRNPYTNGGGLAEALDVSALSATVATKPGAVLVSRLLLLAAAALFVAVLFGHQARAGATGAQQGGDTVRRDLRFGLALGGGVLAIGLAAGWAAAEHASTGIQTAVAIPVDVLHLLAAGLWLGGLFCVFVLLRGVSAVPREAVHRFSGLASVSVAVLAATGVYQAWRQVGSFDALFGTAYGQLLLVKTALVALLVCVGWISRRWTARLREVPEDAPDDEEPEPEPVPAGGDPVRTAQLARQRAAVNAARRKGERERDAERSGLRRSLLVETAIAVAVLAVTTLLTTTEPARTETSARSSDAAGVTEESGPTRLEIPFDTGGKGGEGTAEIAVEPGASGKNEIAVQLEEPEGEPLEAEEVKLALSLTDKDIGPLPAKLAPLAGVPGHWHATGVQIPMAGEWRFALTVRTSDIDQTTENARARIG